MDDFLTYFLSHMPTNDQWVVFLLLNLVSYVAARNTVLRRERRIEEKEFAERTRQMEGERRFYIQSHDELEQLNKEYWAMIQKQAGQIDSLTIQLESARTPHLN